MTSIETPCTKVCVADPRSGICRGCGRSLTEIASWSAYSVGERRRIMAELPQRRAAFERQAAAATDPAGGALR